MDFVLFLFMEERTCHADVRMFLWKISGFDMLYRSVLKTGMVKKRQTGYIKQATRRI